MSQFTVTFIGSLSADYFTVTERFPKNREHLTATDFKQLYRGKGANQALATLNLGRKNLSSHAITSQKKSDLRVCMIGAVGDDIHGAAHIKVLQDYHTDASGLRIVKDQPTGSATIIL